MPQLQAFKLNFCSTLVHTRAHTHTHLTALVGGIRGQLWRTGFLLPPWDPAMELRSSDLRSKCSSWFQPLPAPYYKRVSTILIKKLICNQKWARQLLWQCSGEFSCTVAATLEMHSCFRVYSWQLNKIRSLDLLWQSLLFKCPRAGSHHVGQHRRFSSSQEHGVNKYS